MSEPTTTESEAVTRAASEPIRTLRLVHDTTTGTPPSPPDEHSGQVVIWTPWQLGAAKMPHLCEQLDCFHAGPGWMATATIQESLQPAAPKPPAASHQAHGLYAFACARCQHIEIFETTGRGLRRTDPHPQQAPHAQDSVLRLQPRTDHQ